MFNEKNKIDEETRKRHARIENSILGNRKRREMICNSELNSDWSTKRELWALRGEVEHITEMLYAILEELGCIKDIV